MDMQLSSVAKCKYLYSSLAHTSAKLLLFLAIAEKNVILYSCAAIQNSLIAPEGLPVLIILFLQN